MSSVDPPDTERSTRFNAVVTENLRCDSISRSATLSWPWRAILAALCARPPHPALAHVSHRGLGRSAEALRFIPYQFQGCSLFSNLRSSVEDFRLFERRDVIMCAQSLSPTRRRFLSISAAAGAVILGGASAVIAQRAPRAEQDQQRPNAPIQEKAPRGQQGPANQSADEPRVMRPAVGPNNKQSRGQIEPKKGLDPTTPKGPADQSDAPAQTGCTSCPQLSTCEMSCV